MKNDKVTEEKKELKRNRIKTYFLEAAREIIMKEGYENVSVRKVADMAGYSYATIYNYFKDQNELLWEVKEIMTRGIFEELRGEMHNTTYDMNEIKNGFRVYVSYYFKNPNVFKFFYFYPHGKPDKAIANEYAGPDFDMMWKETFKGLLLEGKLREEDIQVVAKTLIYTIHGLIVIYFSNKEYMTEEMVYQELDEIVDYIL